MSNSSSFARAIEREKKAKINRAAIICQIIYNEVEIVIAKR